MGKKSGIIVEVDEEKIITKDKQNTKNIKNVMDFLKKMEWSLISFIIYIKSYIITFIF